MCGIVGTWSPALGADEIRRALLAMNGSICHRGPDDHGVWQQPDGPLGLAHRRLSILDLSPEGHQPKASPGGRFTIVFNGEIYNFQQLREELRSLGHGFRGHSDTEVLLAGFEQWGVFETARRAAGMFAWAAWDARDGRLTLARDRMGEKPLYYGRAGDSLVFASELKALRQHPHWEGAIDPEALDGFLKYGYVPGPRSIYRGISKLVPGTVAEFDLRSGVESPSVRAYWSLEEVARAGRADPVRGSGAEVIAELDALLRLVIGQEMVSDVPLGAFLSGGVDSSTVVALMQAQSPRPVRTFTIGFHERGFNEAEHAKAVAKHLGTDHTELYVTPAEALAVIPKLPRIYDEPFADPSQIPTYLVSELARRHVTVSLSGDGGDELFAGYNRYFHGQRVWNGVRAIPRFMRAAAAHGARAISPRSWDRLVHGMRWAVPRRYRVGAPGDKLHKLADVLLATQPHELYDQLTTHWRDPRLTTPVTGQRWPAAFEPRRAPDFVSGMMFADAVTYLPDDILVKVDRASMAVSLESRAPFLDHRVVEFAWRVPMDLKLRGATGKWILRELLDRYVPRALIERPKMGFGVPIDSWLRGPLRDWGEELLSERRLAADGLLDAGAVREKWDEHQSGTRNWQYLLWDILMFQAWRAEDVA